VTSLWNNLSHYLINSAPVHLSILAIPESRCSNIFDFFSLIFFKAEKETKDGLFKVATSGSDYPGA